MVDASEKNRGKILALDLSRTVAIVLAMFAHVLTTTGSLKYVLEEMAPLMVVVRTSTPMFIVLFGVILEVVYRQRAEKGGIRPVATRLIERALLCWVLYALANVPLLFTGQVSLPYYLLTALLLGATPFTDILRYYTILFALAPLILYARIRWGVLPLLAGAVLLMAFHPLLAAIPEPNLPVADGVTTRMVDLIIGIWDGAVGPSVLHSLLFVVVGMTIGIALKSEQLGVQSRRQTNITLGSLISFLAISAMASIWIGPEEVNWSNVATKTLRNANHPFYFFSGALVSALTITALRGISSAGSGVFRGTMLGQRSLFTFAFGNAVLYVVNGPYTMTFPAGLLASTVLLLVIFICSGIYDYIEPREAQASGGVLRKFGSRLLHRIIDPVNRSIGKVAAWLTAQGRFDFARPFQAGR
jgi:surface polysaccharide O-acyltransferase-like enzyme